MKRVTSRRRFSSRSSDDFSAATPTSTSTSTVSSPLVSPAMSNVTMPSLTESSVSPSQGEQEGRRKVLERKAFLARLKDRAKGAANSGYKRKHDSFLVPLEVTFESPSSFPFSNLASDLQLAVCEYLDTATLRSMMQVNRRMRSLLLSQEADKAVWLSHCQRSWSIPQSVQQNQAHVFVDAYHLPTAASSVASKTNIPLLLSLTPSNLPTTMDIALMKRPVRRLRSIPPSPPRSSQMEVCRTQDPSTVAVRYTGEVGLGDRCIRANNPLPRPSQDTSAFSLSSLRDAHAVPPVWNAERPRTRFYDFLCRTAMAMMQYPRPFVAPYLKSENNWQVTPSLVAYFEVDILHSSEATTEENTTRHPASHRSFWGARRTECVAIGLGTRSFQVHGRMPGWDSQSVGYHGDDGGVFHASGGMLEQYGPTFGSGDTVGCGIDFVEQAIFYTLNGEFLGYALKHATTFCKLFLEQDLYPVVGIDSHVPVSMNFGKTKPFQFDLAAHFNEQHERYIAPRYQFQGTEEPVLSK
eukprot:Nitzschia sp. Nitz4//scaffold141_size107518//99610//101178//NITZ4_004300-RA/size107518-processed-gene-0.94-mRNA-1//1//CDS//3329536360//5083//frame0